jgi:hypothetical protein
MGALVTQMFVVGSYASTVFKALVKLAVPPTAYKIPFTTPTAKLMRAVDMGSLVVQMFVEG